MRYRRLSYRYEMVVGTGRLLPFGEVWPALLVQGRWRPDADSYETAAAVEVTVDLAGIDENDFEIQLFEDALVVEGQRRLPAGHEGGLYHAAAIRQGPFRVEIPLPAPVEAERVEARYDRGLLRIILPKRTRAG